MERLAVSTLTVSTRKGKGKGKKGTGMRDTVARSIIPGPGLECEERVAWVNALTIDLRKLQRRENGYFYCLWVGFPTSYCEEAAARKEYTPRFNCNFYMQLASDAFTSSNPGLLHGGREVAVHLHSLRTCQLFKRRKPILWFQSPVTGGGDYGYVHPGDHG